MDIFDQTPQENRQWHFVCSYVSLFISRLWFTVASCERPPFVQLCFFPQTGQMRDCWKKSAKATGKFTTALTLFLPFCSSVHLDDFITAKGSVDVLYLLPLRNLTLMPANVQNLILFFYFLIHAVRLNGFAICGFRILPKLTV